MVLPTGSGNSMCFIAIPFFNSLREIPVRDSIARSIGVVISPLTPLMIGQVSMNGSHLQCAFIG